MAPRTASRRRRVSPTPPPDKEDEDDVPSVQHTALHMDLTSLHESEHTRNSVHPYVEQDLRDSQKVEIYCWIEAVLGVPRSRIDEWALQIGEQKWFFDPEVQDHLKKYCEVPDEPERYDPFCGLANRILHLARGNLPGVPKDNSYPIDTVQFIKTYDCMVSKIPEQAQIGAERYLDITFTHGGAVDRFRESKKLDWADVLHYVELKFVDELTDALEEEIKERQRIATQPAVGRKPKAGRGRRPGQKPKASKRSKTETARAGAKRKREVLHPREALKAGSSCAQKTSPKYAVYQGKKGALQSGSYALEVLSCTYGTRAYCHSTVLKDDELCLWYYDACGIIYTDQYLSIINDFEKAAAILVALASCTPERFGILPTFIITPPIPYQKSLPPRTLTDSILRISPHASKKRYKITLKDSLYTQYVLAGRRTFAYSMTSSPQLSKQNLMAKFSYQVNTRRPEYEYIDIARKAGVDHLPQYHASADLWKMSDGARRVFFADAEETPYEDRTLRMIVYTEYGSIKTLFAERCDLMPVMVIQMVNCLHDLRYKANILHRDISVNNIMFEKRGEMYHFILNDFDMATLLSTGDGSSYTPSSKHRTGTLPFMAHSLLRDAFLNTNNSLWHATRHLLCHDYESLFWVCFWCVLALFLDYLPEDARKKNRAALKSWEGPDLQSVYRAKLDTCTTRLKYTTVALAPPTLCLTKWLDGWIKLLWHAHQLEKEQEMEQPDDISSMSDPDAANNVLTKDNILKVLTPLMPSLESQGLKKQESDEGEQEQRALKGRKVTLRRRNIIKKISAEAEAARAAIMSRLRPRKAT